MRSMVSAEALAARPLMTLLTVIGETLAATAMSLIVARGIRPRPPGTSSGRLFRWRFYVKLTTTGGLVKHAAGG
jgi:hypothetical protein